MSLFKRMALSSPSSTGQKTAANSTSVVLASDANVGKLYSFSLTLSGTVNTVQQVNIPTGSLGFRLYSAASDILYNVNAAPAAPISAKTAGSAITVSSSEAGNVAIAGVTETRLLDTTATVLHLASSTASAVVRVGFF